MLPVLPAQEGGGVPGSYEAAEQGADQRRVPGPGGRALVLLRRRCHRGHDGGQLAGVSSQHQEPAHPCCESLAWGHAVS